MLNKYDLDLQNGFHLSGTVWFMNAQLLNANRDYTHCLPLRNLSLIRLYKIDYK